MAQKFPREVLPVGLRLGDIIRIGNSPYLDATVTEVTADKVVLIRPYLTLGYTVVLEGGISKAEPLLGWETMTFLRNSSRTVTLVEQRLPGERTNG